MPWHTVKHPQYGTIEVGGMKKQYTRAVPGFLLQAEAHRNMAFTVYQAMQLPLVRVDSVRTRSRIELANLPGMGTATVRWIVRGDGPFTVTIDSAKGGVHRRTGR